MTAEKTKIAEKAAIISDDVAGRLASAKSPEEFKAIMTDAIEAAALALVARAGPVPALAARLIVGQVVEPIVGALMTVVTHIGMAVPQQLGELIERIESGVGFDINGDGFVGDPEAEKADGKSA